MFLTHEEVVRLTGRKTRDAQIRHLHRLRIDYYLDADGRPVIPRSVFEHDTAASDTEEPDWSAFNGTTQKKAS